MTTQPLEDQVERERIEQQLDRTLFVEAGAGTGKTHELVLRIVNLIASGEVQASEIAAITFTERAAAELYDRVLEELDRMREEEPDPERQRFFIEASNELDQVAIETLHAFAARILRLHLIEAGLPPGFQIMDDAQSPLHFSDRWLQALDQMLENETLAEPLLVLFEAGVELSDIEAVALELHEDWDRAASAVAEIEAGEVDTSAFLQQFAALIDMGHGCTDPSDKLYLRLQEYRPYLDDLKASEHQLGKLVRLLSLTKPSFKVGRTGRKGSWGDDVQRVRDAAAEIDAERALLRSQIVLWSCAPVFNALRCFVLDYADERRKFGMLSFQDLLVRASQLLSDNQAVADSLHRRFKRLLIDEFQDNDPLQTQIIDGITKQQPGRAFFVGDPKQSIYRFRRADIQQFNSVKHVQQSGLTRLSQNFRSTPGVTEFVNAVFRPLMEEGGATQAEWEDLRAFRDPLDDDRAAVTVVGDAYPGRIQRIKAEEADALARIIADITHSGWQIFDKQADAVRSARFADTAVLVPTRNGLVNLLPELERRNIPYRLESRSLVYNSREVRDLLNLLRAIEDPTDQVSLVAALHSNAFACADDDLFRWREASGRWDYRAPRPPDIASDDPVAESMQWLNEVAGRRWEWSVSELVGLVIRERRLLELSVLERQPREAWARYRFLHDQARAFCDGGGSTLSEFLAWARHQADNDTRVIESIVPEQDHDAVRIMTIHAAKGLEFPIVVLAGLNSPPRSTAPSLLWTSEGRPEVRWRSALTTPGFEAAWEREKELVEQEYVRRNYVGATRARDHLIVSLFRKESKKESKADGAKIDRVLETVDAPHRRLALDEIPSPPMPAVDPPPAALSNVEELQRRERWLDQRATSVRRHGVLPRETATGFRPGAHVSSDGTAASPNLEQPDTLPPWRRGRAGTNIGRALHAVLQVVDIEQPDETEIRNAARAQASAEGLVGRNAETVNRLAQRAARSPVVREAVAAPRYWRELYAATEINGVLVDGFVDLLFELPNGDLVVIDYKTDALSSGEAVSEAVERYRDQLAAYAMILEQSLGRRVDRGVLYFLEPDEARVVPNLAERMAHVRGLLSSE